MVENRLHEFGLLEKHVAEVVVAHKRNDVFQNAARPHDHQLHALGQIRLDLLEQGVIALGRVRPFVRLKGLPVGDRRLAVQRFRRRLYARLLRKMEIEDVAGRIVVAGRRHRVDNQPHMAELRVLLQAVPGQPGIDRVVHEQLEQRDALRFLAAQNAQRVVFKV